MKPIRYRFEKLTRYFLMEELGVHARKKLNNKLYRPLYDNIDWNFSMLIRGGLKREFLNEAN
jgi:hypothetical protein